jgi:ATP/maltotriose-dependent transcriptional regulator MalT
MFLAVKNGGVSPDLLSAIHLLPKVNDPLIRSSFLNVWCTLLVFTGDYEKALEVSDQQLAEAKHFRLAFVLPHIHLRRAGALRGLRRFQDALGSLEQVQSYGPELGDFLVFASRSVRLGIHLAQGNVRAALEIPEPGLPANTTTAHVAAELIAARALAFAVGHQATEARSAAELAESLSTAVEPKLLSNLARAISSIETGSPDAAESAIAAFEDVERSGNTDSFVTAYRAYPRLLEVLSTASARRTRLASILEGSRDFHLARAIGLKSDAASAKPLLSKREREVLELLTEGLKNREIAERLFISELTVKAHVRNVLQKLGARSRAHAVSLASRSGQLGGADDPE